MITHMESDNKIQQHILKNDEPENVPKALCHPGIIIKTSSLWLGMNR